MSVFSPLATTSRLQRALGDLWHEHFTEPLGVNPRVGNQLMAPPLQQQRGGQWLPSPFEGNWDIMRDPFALTSNPLISAANTPRYPLQTDINETNEEYVLNSDACGIPRDQLDVFIENNEYLVIKGNRDEVKEDISGTAHRAERTFGAFHRRFKLPSDVDLVADVDAAVSDGVLTVKLKKLEEDVTAEHVRKIELHD